MFALYSQYFAKELRVFGAKASVFSFIEVALLGVSSVGYVDDEQIPIYPYTHCGTSCSCGMKVNFDANN